MHGAHVTHQAKAFGIFSKCNLYANRLERSLWLLFRTHYTVFIFHRSQFSSAATNRASYVNSIRLIKRLLTRNIADSANLNLSIMQSQFLSWLRLDIRGDRFPRRGVPALPFFSRRRRNPVAVLARHILRAARSAGCRYAKLQSQVHGSEPTLEKKNFQHFLLVVRFIWKLLRFLKHYLTIGEIYHL